MQLAALHGEKHSPVTQYVVSYLLRRFAAPHSVLHFLARTHITTNHSTMAEAIALVASIIAIVQLADRIISLGTSYIASAKGARKEITKLRLGLGSLSDILVLLVDHAEANPDSPALRILYGPSSGGLPGPVEMCMKELQELQSKLEPPEPSGRWPWTRRDTKSSIMWPFKEKEVMHSVSEIDRYKSLFQLALGVDQAYAGLFAIVFEEPVADTSPVQDSIESNRRSGPRHKLYCSRYP